MRKTILLPAFLLLLLIPQVSASTLPELNIENISPSEPGPGDSFSVDLKIEGGRESFQSTGLRVETVEGIQYLGTTSATAEEFRLCAGCIRTSKHYFRISEEAVAGTYPLKFVLEGSSGTGSVGKYDIKVEADSKLVFNSEKMETVPGEDVEGSFTLKNTGKDTASDITVGFGNSHLSVKPGEMDIGSLEPGESYTGEIEILSDDSLESGFRRIDVNIDFKEDSQQKKKSSQMTLELLEQAELAMEDFRVEEGVIGDRLGVTVDVENLGPGRAEKLKSELSCEGAEMDVSKAFVGKLNDDESVPMVFQIVPEQKKVECLFRIDYEDRKQRTMEVENTFFFSRKSYTGYYIGGAAVIAAIALFFYNKRKEDELEEV